MTLKLWWLQTTPVQNNKMLMSLNMQAQLPETIRQCKALQWQGRWPKQFQLNIPELQLRPGAVVDLKKSPHDAAGLQIDYEFPGTPYYNTETALITSWPNNVGTFAIETVDPVRRVAVAWIQANFVVKDTTMQSCEKEIGVQFRLRFGY